MRAPVEFLLHFQDSSRLQATSTRIPAATVRRVPLSIMIRKIREPFPHLLRCRLYEDSVAKLDHRGSVWQYNEYAVRAILPARCQLTTCQGVTVTPRMTQSPPRTLPVTPARLILLPAPRQ